MVSPATAAESGTVFDDVKFESKEWAEYDEEGKQAVGIYDLQHKFIKVKYRPRICPWIRVNTCLVWHGARDADRQWAPKDAVQKFETETA
ncbi:hypothetical protein MRX96_031079 [Rhipicephalus microplus]